MKENNIILHVGYPKAASTTLQKHLFSKHSQLLNLGVYPTNNIGNDTGELLENIVYNQDNKLREFYNNLNQLDDIEYSQSGNEDLYNDCLSTYVNQTNKISIFSDEKLTSVFFAYPDVGVKAKRLAQIFPQSKVVIIIRNQYQWLKSQYRDHPFDPRNFTVGKPVSFDKWFNILHWDKSIKLLHVLNYYSVIEHYKNLFGKDRVGVFLFEELANDAALFSNKISEFMGIEKGEALNILCDKHENSGVSARYNSFRSAKRSWLPVFVSKIIEKHFTGFIKSGKKKNYELSLRNIALMNDYFIEGNKKLSTDYDLNLAKYKYPGMGEVS